LSTRCSIGVRALQGLQLSLDLAGGDFTFGINDIEHQLEKEREGERMREENCYRPSTSLAEELEVTMAMSVTQVSVKGSTERSERSVVTVALPVAGSASLDRLGFLGGFSGGSRTSCLEPLAPTSSL
jgi:hypothetical protein